MSVFIKLRKRLTKSLSKYVYWPIVSGRDDDLLAFFALLNRSRTLWNIFVLRYEQSRVLFKYL